MKALTTTSYWVDLMKDIIGNPKFNLGEISLAESALEAIDRGLLVDLYIDRHWRGDHGKGCGADDYGESFSSAYPTAFGIVHLITDIDSDPPHTTVLTM